MLVIWMTIAILCLIAELLNRKCAYMWFAISSFLAFIIHCLKNWYVLEFIVFIIGGFVLLTIFREDTINKIDNYITKNIINKKGKVIKELTNNKKGQIRIGFITYIAKSKTNIKKGTKIKVIGYNNHIVEVVRDKS